MSCFALHLLWFSVYFSLSCSVLLAFLLVVVVFGRLFFFCCFWLLFCFVSEGIVSSYVILFVFLLVLLSVSVDFILKRLLGFSGLVVFYFSCGVILGGDGMVGWLFV